MTFAEARSRLRALGWEYVGYRFIYPGKCYVSASRTVNARTTYRHAYGVCAAEARAALVEELAGEGGGEG